MLRARQCQAAFLRPSTLSLGRRTLVHARAPPERLGHGLLVVASLSGQDGFRQSSGAGPTDSPSSPRADLSENIIGSSSDATLYAKPPKPWWAWSSWWVGLIVLGAAMCLFKPSLVTMLLGESTKATLALSTAANVLLRKISIRLIVEGTIALVTTFVGIKLLQEAMNDLRKAVRDLNNVLDGCGADLKSDLGGLRCDLKSELRAYRVERRQQVHELCSEIKRNREEERESLENMKKTAFLEGQMAAKRGW